MVTTINSCCQRVSSQSTGAALEPKVVNTSSASSKDGKDISPSITRITTASTLPPLYPLPIPTTVPRAMPSAAPATAIVISERAPDIIRLRRSRPNWSVPSK